MGAPQHSNGVYSPPPTPAAKPNGLNGVNNVDMDDSDSASSTGSHPLRDGPPLASPGMHRNGDRPDFGPGNHDEVEADDFDLHRRTSRPIPAFGVHEQDAGDPPGRSQARIRSYTDDAHLKKFPRISRPVELMRSSYDCLVIGSGYGGSIAASRMARAGQSVCLLERGREKWPGEYPTGPIDALKELHFSGDFAPFFSKGKTVSGGDPTGMYHLIFGKGQNAIVGNGKHEPTNWTRGPGRSLKCSTAESCVH